MTTPAMQRTAGPQRCVGIVIVIRFLHCSLLMGSVIVVIVVVAAGPCHGTTSSQYCRRQ
jgi:hypothetical protein